MEIIAPASFVDFRLAYEWRESHKPEDTRLARRRFHCDDAEWQQRHDGKCPFWFLSRDTYWMRVRLDQQEFERLCIIDGPQSREPGIVLEGVPRTLRNGAAHARETAYFLQETTHQGIERHRDYYRRLAERKVRLRDADAITIRRGDADLNCGSWPQESTYYLHDGYGRSLPYLTLVLEQKLAYEPVEALCAVEFGC